MKLDLHLLLVFGVLCLAQGVFRPPEFFAVFPAFLVQPMILTKFLDTTKLKGKQEGTAFIVQNEVALLVAAGAMAGLYASLR